MAQENKILYSIDFDVNKKKIEQLKKSLQDIKKMSISDVAVGQAGNNDLSKMKQQLRQAQQAARVTEEAITKAFNPKLNTVNIQKFENELKISGLNMDTLRKKMQAIGPSGARAFGQLQTSVFKMGQAVKQTHTAIDKMYTTFTNSIKWGLSSAVINGFTNTIQQAWGYVKSLDTSLNDIRIVTGKSADEMDRFAEKANSVAQGLGKSTTDYTKAALIYAQQGLNDKEVEARTQVTLKTANVTGQSAEDVSEQLTAVWNGYKVSAEQAEVYVDRLAAVAATTASNLNELSTGMSKVASAAAAMGVGEDQLAAQLSTIISVTKQAPQSVGTALRTVYARITDIKAGVEEDGTTLGQYSGKMAQMGINVLDLNGNLRDMGTVMEEIGAKWGDMSREQQVYLAQTMAGQRQYNNLLALFDNFDKYNAALQTAQDATGTLQQQQDTYMESANAHLNELKAATENIYDSLLNPKRVIPILDVFTKLANVVATFVDGLGGGAGVLSLLGTIGLNVFGDKIANSIQKTVSNTALANAEMTELEVKINKLRDIQNSKEASPAEQEWAKEQADLLEKQKNLNNLIPNEVLQKAEELNTKLRDLNERLAEAESKKDSISSRVEKIAENNNLQPMTIEEDGKQVQPSGFQAYTNPEDVGFSESVNQVLQTELANVQTLKSELGQLSSTFLNSFESSKQSTDAAIDAYVAAQEKVQKLKQEMEKMTGEEIEASGKLEEFFEALENVDKAQQNLQEMGETSGGLASQFDQIKEKVNEMVESFSQNKAGVVSEEEINKLKNFQSALENINPNQLESKFPQIIQILGQFRGNLNLTEDQIKKLQEMLSNPPSENAEGLSDQIEKTKKAFEELKNSMDGAILAKGLTDALGGVASLTTGFTQMSNAGKAFGEMAVRGFNLQSLEKFASSAAASAMSLINGYKKLSSTLKTVKQVMNLTKAAMEAKRAATKKDKAATDLDTAAQQKHNAANKQSIPATQQATGAEKAHTGAVAGSIVPTEGATTATYGLSAAFHALLGPIGIVIGLVTLATTAFSIYQGVTQAQAEADREAAQAKKELAQENENALNSELEFYNAVEELYKQYEQGEITRAQLQSSIEQLGKQYDIEGEKLAALKNSYQDFYDTINRLKNNAAIAGESEAQIAAESATDLIDTSKLEKYSKMGHELGGSSGYVKQQAVYDAKTVAALEQAGYTRISQEQITNAGNTRAAEDWGTHAGAYATGVLLTPFGVGVPVAGAMEAQNLKNKQNEANVEYSGDLVRSFDVNNKADLVKQYGQTMQNIQKFTELGLDESIIKQERDYLASLTQAGAKEAYQEYANKLNYSEQRLSISAKEDLSKVNSIDSYAKIKDDLFTELKNEYGDYFSEQQLKSKVNDILSSANNESFNKFNGLTEIAEKNGLDISAMPKEVADAYGELNESQITELLSLDPTLLKDWDSIKNNITAIANTKIPTPFSEAEIDAAATKFQQINDVIDKISSGKSIGVKDFKELDISDDIKEKYFRQGLNGYEMIGDRKDFEKAMKMQQIKPFSDLEQGSLYRQNIFQNRKDFISVAENQKLVKNTRKQRDTFNPDDYTSDFYTSQDAQNLSQNMLDILKETDFGQTEEGKEQFKQLQQQLNKGATQEIFNAILKQYDKNVKDEDFDLSKLNEKIQIEVDNAKEAGDMIYDALFPTDVDLKETDIYNLQQTIQDLAYSSDELNDGLKSNTRNAKALSEQILRFNDGLMDAAKNISNWKTQLESGALTSVTGIRDAYSDMLNLDGESLSETFLRSTENLDLMNIALTGTEEEAKAAFDRLKELAQQDILFQIGIDNNTYEESTETLRNLVKDSQIGDSLNDALIEPFFNMLVQAGATAGQIKDIFEGMDIRIQFSVDENGNPLKYQSGSATKTGDTDFLWKQRSQELEKQAKTLKKQQQAQVDTKKAIQDQRDLYHDINIELDKINSKLNRAQKEQKKLYGKDLIKGLQKQQDLLNQEIKILKDKQAIQKADQKMQQQQLAAKGVTFNSNGNISNYMPAMTAAQNKVDSLTNQYNTLANAYNASRDTDEKQNLKQQMDAVNKDLSSANTDLNDLKTSISNYDKLIKDMDSVENKIQDDVDAAIENHIQQLNLKASLTLELGQAKREWEEFKRNVLERDSVLYTDAFTKTSKDANQHLSNAESYYTSGSMKANTEKLQRAMTAAQNIRKYGTDKDYGDNMALAMKDAQDASKELQDELRAVAEQLDAIDQAYLDTIDNIQQMYNKQKQAYQKYGEQLSHDLDLIKLVYGQKNYKAMDKYYNKLHKNNVNHLDFLKKTNDENYRRWQEAEKQAEQYAKQNGIDSDKAKQAAQDAKRFKEAYLNGVSDINSAITQSIQNLKDQYSNAIVEIFDNMEKQMTNGKSFDYMDAQWDLMKKKANLYLDTVNSAFAIKNTQFAFTKALNDTKGLKSQQQLKKVMNEQLTILKQKDKLTQYDVDRAQKILEVEKARIALEEARNNKTQMRLKRDSQGNYSYQYVADQDNIGQAENNLAKAENDLYNFDKENYEKNLEAAYNATKELKDKLSELWDEYNANYQNPEKQAEIMQQIKMVQKEYTDYINNLSQESMYQQQNMIDSGIESYKLSLENAGQAFSDMTDEQKRKWMEQEGFVPTFNSGIQEMIEKFSTNDDSLEKIVSRAIDNLQDKNEEYQGKIHQLEESAGIDLAAVANGYDEIAIKIGGEDGQGGLIKNNDDLLDKMNDEYDKMDDLKERGQELRKKYEEVTKQAELAVEQFQKMWTEEQTAAIQAAADAVNNVAKAYNAAAGSLAAYQRQKTGGGTATTQPPPKTTPLPSKTSPKSKKSFKLGTWIKNSQGQVYRVGIFKTVTRHDGILEGPTDVNAETATAEQIAKAYIDSRHNKNDLLISPSIKEIENFAPNQKSLAKSIWSEIAHLIAIRPNTTSNKDNFKKMTASQALKQPNIAAIPFAFIKKYDTGGYTGDWSSSQGKLAVLHQKELVLNKQDTANMLEMIAMVREMQQQELQFRLSSLNNEIQDVMKQNAQVEKIKTQQKLLEQSVSISASFPSVNSKKEIEEALSELMNKATQIALKYKKN